MSYTWDGLEREAWYSEADDDDFAPPDIEKWESQLRDLIGEAENLPTPSEVPLEDALYALQQEAQELWQKLHIIMEDYPQKIRALENELDRIRAGRLIYSTDLHFKADRSSLPGPTDEWDEAEMDQEEWESDIQGDE